MTRNRESGQALVLVLLSLSVVLTLVLFILARSITDVTVSSRQEESVRAFSAAEAGIERALVAGTGFGTTEIGNASYTTSVTDFALGGNDMNFPAHGLFLMMQTEI
jgi:Tfp pilus assembly protein PilX